MRDKLLSFCIYRRPHTCKNFYVTSLKASIFRSPFFPSYFLREVSSKVLPSSTLLLASFFDAQRSRAIKRFELCAGNTLLRFYLDFSLASGCQRGQRSDRLVDRLALSLSFQPSFYVSN